MALNINFNDFEDAIQYSTGMINQLDIILARNIKDFPVKKPKALTPNQFLQQQ